MPSDQIRLIPNSHLSTKPGQVHIPALSALRRGKATMDSLPNLPAAVSRVAFATLCTSLPRLAVDTPENRAARDEAAMIAVAALHPADGFEAKLAAEIVAADAWVMDNHRLAAEFRNDTAVTLRCCEFAASGANHSALT